MMTWAEIMGRLHTFSHATTDCIAIATCLVVFMDHWCSWFSTENASNLLYNTCWLELGSTLQLGVIYFLQSGLRSDSKHCFTRDFMHQKKTTCSLGVAMVATGIVTWFTIDVFLHVTPTVYNKWLWELLSSLATLLHASLFYVVHAEIFPRHKKDKKHIFRIPPCFWGMWHAPSLLLGIFIMTYMFMKTKMPAPIIVCLYTIVAMGTTSLYWCLTRKEKLICIKWKRAQKITLQNSKVGSHFRTCYPGVGSLGSLNDYQDLSISETSDNRKDTVEGVLIHDSNTVYYDVEPMQTCVQAGDNISRCEYEDRYSNLEGSGALDGDFNLEFTRDSITSLRSTVTANQSSDYPGPGTYQEGQVGGDRETNCSEDVTKLCNVTKEIRLGEPDTEILLLGLATQLATLQRVLANVVGRSTLNVEQSHPAEPPEDIHRESTRDTSVALTEHKARQGEEDMLIHSARNAISEGSMIYGKAILTRSSCLDLKSTSHCSPLSHRTEYGRVDLTKKKLNQDETGDLIISSTMRDKKSESHINPTPDDSRIWSTSTRRTGLRSCPSLSSATSCSLQRTEYGQVALKQCKSEDNLIISSAGSDNRVESERSYTADESTSSASSNSTGLTLNWPSLRSVPSGSELAQLPNSAREAPIEGFNLSTGHGRVEVRHSQRSTSQPEVLGCIRQEEHGPILPRILSTLDTGHGPISGAHSMPTVHLSQSELVDTFQCLGSRNYVNSTRQTMPSDNLYHVETVHTLQGSYSRRSHVDTAQTLPKYL